MKTFDHLSTTAEIGRINPIDEPLREEVVCPQMVFNGKAVMRPTMSIEQCLGRGKTNQFCATKCNNLKIAINVRKKKTRSDSVRQHRTK